MKKIKIQFIKSPTGAFKLAYSIGQEMEIDAERGRELIEANFAIPVMTETKAKKTKRTASAKQPKKETR